MTKDNDLTTCNNSENEHVYNEETGEWGVWRTVFGRKLFIADGKSLSEAMKASGKFPQNLIDAVTDNENNKSKQAEKNENAPLSHEELSAYLGREFVGLKGADAIKKIMQEKEGHVKGAFYREDVGPIDIFWGDESAGLKHIITNREKAGESVDKLLDMLPETIKTANLVRAGKAPDTLLFMTQDKQYRFVLGYTYKGHDLQYVLTAFYRHKKKKPSQ